MIHKVEHLILYGGIGQNMDRTDIQNAVFPAPDRFCFCGAAADAEAFRVPELFLFFLFLQKLLYFPQLHFVFFLSGKFPVFLPELRGSDSVLFKKYPVKGRSC